ncbi:MAG: glycosyltransferase [Patescibacteria group bacterium]|jgi:glycosyltransferase involved in cell wall biosynthesis
MTNISHKDNTNKELKGKKILYIITQTKFGGAQKYVLALAKYFGEDNEIHVAYGEEKNTDSKFLEELKQLNIKSLPIPYLIRNIDFSKDYLATMEILKIYNAGKYDLVHLNSSKVGLLGALAARMYSANITNTKLRILYTAHGFVFNEPLSKFKKKLYTFSEKISSSINHAVITVSEADRQSAIDNKLAPENKIITIHNGIDIDNTNFYDRFTALEKLGLDKNKKYFGTIASFYKTKGYSYLVEAIKILQDEQSPLLENYQWVLIGDGPELENIKQQIKDNNLDKYFKLLGAKDTAHKYLKAFTAFILPSVKEGLPYVLLEAGLAKIPVIATKVGGIPEIIKDKETGLLVSPANPLSLATAIKEIDKINSNILEKNYQNIVSNFDLKQSLAKTKELYLRLF